MLKWAQTIFYLLPILLNAQVSSSKGRFTVFFDKGCTPMTVNVVAPDSIVALIPTYSFFEGSNGSSSTTFTYDSPGTYQIVQLIDDDDLADKTDTLFVEAVEPQKPRVIYTQCSNQELSVQSVDTFYDFIRVYFEGSDSVTLLPNDVTSFTFSSAGAQAVGLKGFFDNADELCDIFFDETFAAPELSAPSLQSVSIKETCRGLYTLFITLDAFDTLVNYRVFIEQETKKLVYDGFIDSTNLVIGNIPFNVAAYCVTIESFDPCNNASAESNSVCESPTTLSLSPFESLYSTYTDSLSIYINLDPVTTGTFEVQRRFDGGEFEPRLPSMGAYNDPIGSSSRRYFYQINYIDSCNNLLYSAETHPPHLSSELISANQYSVTFSQADNSLINLLTTNYTIGNPDAQSVERISAESFDLRLLAENGVPRQLLTATSEYGGNILLQSNTLTLKYELVIYAPNAFTPNGDGLNDRLDFFGLPSENASVSIYNRWGQLVYSANSATEGWDGMIAGNKAPEGTYLYEIVFETVNGNKQRQKGTFVLINK